MRGSGMTGEREGMAVLSGRGERWSLGNISMDTRRDGKGVAIGVEHWRAVRLRALGAGSVES